MDRHVKIVCTLGPASNSPDIIENMLKAGMNVARLNLSYGTLEEHRKIIRSVRTLSRELNLPAGVMIDLPGYKRHSGSIAHVFKEQLEFGESEKVDFIALSFITSEEQVSDVKKLLQEIEPTMPVIVKVEKAEALERSSAILDASDGIMVARGDLALEISIEKVPLAQKRLVNEANRRGKSVITATQMLESMVREKSPTRAEATDVANAVLDGSDAITLSEETAIGSYPVEAVGMMNRIAIEAEAAFPYEQLLASGAQDILPEINDATARAACQIAHQVSARAIVTFTAGRTTALRVAKYRPRQPVIAVTPTGIMASRLTLPWGVLPVIKPEPEDLEHVFEMAQEAALETGIAVKGDLLVITAGIPLRVPGNTNLVRVLSV